MIKVNNPTLKSHAKLMTIYIGENRKIVNTGHEFTIQDLIFKEKFMTNGGELNNLCFEFNLLNRRFMMALDLEKLFEVIGEGEDKAYIRLTNSRFYVMKTFVHDNRIVYKISLTLHYEYTPESEYLEHFKLQFSMRNHEDVIKMLSIMRSAADAEEEEFN